MIGAGFIGSGAGRRRGREPQAGTITAAVVPATSALVVGERLADTANWAVFTAPANYATPAAGETIASVSLGYTGDTGSATEPLADGDLNVFTVTVTDTGGLTRTFFTQARTVQYAPPVATGALADQTVTAGSGVSTLDVSGDFSGAGLSYGVSGPAAVTIDAGTGLLQIDTDALAPVADLAVVVTATNSGGTAQSAFSLTVLAAPVAPAQMGAPMPTATGTTELTVTLAADPDDGGAPILRRDLRWRPAGGTWTVMTDITGPVPLGGLVPETDYEVQTRAANTVGTGPWSATGTARTRAIPTTFSRVVFVGASILNDVYGSDLSTRNSAAEAAFAAAGATVEVYANTADGEDAGAAAQRLTDAMAVSPDDTLFFVHTGGNNVTPNRPYPGGAATLDAQMAALADIAAIRPGTVILSDLTFRDYDDTTAGNEAAGSKPYNDSLLRPLFDARRSDLAAQAYYADGTPVACLYEWSYYNRTTYLAADTIHPSPAGVIMLRDWLAARLAPVCTNAALPPQATRITLDLEAPVLSAPGGQPGGQTSATALQVTTDEAGGTLYWGLYAQATNPTVADVIAGTGAAAGGAQAVTVAGPQAVPDATGLTAGTGYRAWYLHEDAAGNRSALAGSAPFVTGTAPAPALTEIFVQYGTNTATGVNTPAFNDFATNAGATSDGPFDLLNSDGSDPGVRLSLAYSAPSTGDAAGFGINPFGRSTGVPGFDGTLYNDVFTTDNFYVGSANTLDHVISGLTPDTGYTVELIASRAATGSRETLYSFADGQSATLETTADPVSAPVSVNTLSDASGVITITQSANTGSWSYLGGLRIAETPVAPSALQLEGLGEEPVITATGGTLSVTVATGPYAGTYTTRATDGAALTVAIVEAAPTPIALPVISGTETQGETLTATPGLWLYDGPDPGDQTWEWRNDTDGLTGDTELSYDLSFGDVGDVIRIDETFGGVTVSSAGTGAIAAGVTPAPDTITSCILWADYESVDNIWQDAARTSAVTTDGQFIKGATDRTGTGNHIGLDAGQNTWDATEAAMAFGGDGTELSKVQLASNASWDATAAGWDQMDVFVLMKTTDTNFMMGSGQTTGRTVGIAESGVALSGHSGQSVPTYSVDGATISPDLRSDLHSAWATGAYVIVGMEGFAPHQISLGGAFNMFSMLAPGFDIANGHVKHIVWLRNPSAADRTAALNYLNSRKP